MADDWARSREICLLLQMSASIGIFTRKGDNIYVTVPITVSEAALGAKIEVPTVEGKAQLKIPAGTESGQKFRLRERGFPSLRNPNLRGDQFIEVQITLPRVISEETKEILREFEKANPGKSAQGDGFGIIYERRKQDAKQIFLGIFALRFGFRIDDLGVLSGLDVAGFRNEFNGSAAEFFY